MSLRVDCGHSKMRRSRCWNQKNGLGRTAANLAERDVLTRYAETKKVRLSKHPAAGNPAGKLLARLPNIANLLQEIPGVRVLSLAPDFPRFFQYQCCFVEVNSSHSVTRFCA